MREAIPKTVHPYSLQSHISADFAATAITTLAFLEDDVLISGSNEDKFVSSLKVSLLILAMHCNMNLSTSQIELDRKFSTCG